MKSKLTWFKFTPADWLMGRISRQNAEVQCDFIRLCCLYWNKGCEFTFEDAESELPDTIEKLIKLKIVKTNGEFIGIEFLDEQMNEIAEASKKQSERAKQRWKDKPKADATAMPHDATAMPPHTSGNAADMQIREDKNREDESEKEKNAHAIVSVVEIPVCYSAPKFFTKKEELREVLKDHVSTELFLGAGLQSHEIEMYIEPFLNLKSVKLPFNFDPPDLRAHFVNWIGKQKEKPKQTGTKKTQPDELDALIEASLKNGNNDERPISIG